MNLTGDGCNWGLRPRSKPVVIRVKKEAIKMANKENLSTTPVDETVEQQIDERQMADMYGEGSETIDGEEAAPAAKEAAETPKAKKSKKAAAPAQTKVTAKQRKLNPEDITEEELNYIYSLRRTYTVNNKERSQYYNGGNEVTYFGEKATGGEKRSEKDEAIILTAAARTIPPEILTGIVVGYTETETEHIPMVQVDLEGSEGYNQIRIPVDHFMNYDKASFQGESGRKRLKQYVAAYFGAKIRFCVYEYNEKEHLAYGTRLKAMEIISRYYYRATNKRGLTRIQPGEAVKATVIAVYKDRVVVDACGVDIVIKSRELSWLPIGYVYEEFSVGDEFPVKILEISGPVKVVAGSQTYTTHNVTASRRELTTNPATKYFDRYKAGDIVQGVIKSENSASGIFVIIQGHIQVLCDTVPGNPPLNSTCQVLIVNKYEDTKMIRGAVIPNTIRPPKAIY